MRKLPTNAPGPEPGDFDEDLAAIADAGVERHDGLAGAKLTRVVRVSGEDAARLDALAAERGLAPGEIVAELVRKA